MKQRIITGAGLVALLVLILFTKTFTTYFFDALIILITLCAGFEISYLLKKMGMYNSKWAILAFPVLSYVLYKLCELKQVEFYIAMLLQVMLIIIIACVVIAFHILAKNRTDNEIKTRKLNLSVGQFSLNKGIYTMAGMLYPSFILMILYVVNNLKGFGYAFTKLTGHEGNISLFLLIYTFAIPAIIDTFAMLTGRILKGKKLCPKLSPNKTISGSIGGLVWGTLGAIALFYIFNAIEAYNATFVALNIVWWKVLIVGFASSIFCQVGDLFESHLKRKAEVKDSGDILPGHGGILDRMDSHIANIIIVFIFLLFIGV